MNDFTVLHLSDLHIDNTDGDLSVLLENLLKDIIMRIKRSKVVKKNAGKRYEHLEQSVSMMQPGRNGRSEFLQFNDL